MRRTALLAVGSAAAGGWLLAPRGSAFGLAPAILLFVLPLAWSATDRRYAPGPARERARFLLTLCGSLAFLAALSFASGGVRWGHVVFTAVSIGIFALLGLGLGMEFGAAGLINFGHVAFMAIGAYVAVLLSVEPGYWALFPGALGPIGFVLLVLLAMLAAALAGVLLGLPTLRLRADYLAIVTIAAAEILRRVLINEDQVTGGTRGVSGFPSPLGDRTRGAEWLSDVAGFIGAPGSEYKLVLLALVVVAVVAALIVVERLLRSPWGRSLKAVRDDEAAAEALGKDAFRLKLQTLALGSAAAGLAGAFWAWHNSSIHPSGFEPIVTFYVWILVILGGATNARGAVAGAALFWAIWEAVRVARFGDILGLDAAQTAALRIGVFGLILVLAIGFKPEGVLGKKEEMPIE